jgi:hypothetical protein
LTVKSPFGHLTLEETLVRYSDLITGLEGKIKKLEARKVEG